RLARTDPEQRGVEAGHLIEHAARGDVGGIVAKLAWDAGIQLVRGEEAHTLAPLAEVAPQRLDVLGTGEASRHAHDGDRLCRARRNPALAGLCRRHVVVAGPP